MTCDSQQGVPFLQFDFVKGFSLITIFLFSVFVLDSQQTSIGVDMRKSLMHIDMKIYILIIMETVSVQTHKLCSHHICKPS